MVSTRGGSREPGRAKSPLGEVDRNRRPTRLAASYPKQYNDSEFVDSEDDFSDFEELPQKNGGTTKSSGKGDAKDVPRRSSRRSVPAAVAPPHRGGSDGERAGGSGRAGSGGHHHGEGDGHVAETRRHTRASELRDQPKRSEEDEEDEEPHEEEGGAESPQLRETRARNHHPPTGNGDSKRGGGGGGADGGAPPRRHSARLSHMPPPAQAPHTSDEEGSEDSEEEEEEEDDRRGGRSARHDRRDRNRERDSKRRAGGGGGGGGGGGAASDSGSEEGDSQGEGEDEDEDDEGGCVEDDAEEADDGGIWKGRYHLRGHQVNQLRGPPPKRPRYSEGPSGGGGRRRPDHDDDDDEEEGSSEEEEEDDEEEEAGGKAAGRQERDRGRDRSRKRDRKGGGGPAARVRYTLRDRSRMVPMSVQEQQRQKEELQREMMARQRIRERIRSGPSGGGHGSKHGGGGGGGGGGGRDHSGGRDHGGGGGGRDGYRRHHDGGRGGGGGGGGGWGWRGGMSDDDVADPDGPAASGGNPWRGMQQAFGQLPPWQLGAQVPATPLPGLGPSAHGGAQMVPSSVLHGANAAGGAGPSGLGGGGGGGGGGAAGAAGGGGGGVPMAAWEQALVNDAAALAGGGGGGKEKAGNAEINPVAVDPSVGFDQVGGLDAYVEALKEMVFLPLVYPELFDRFHVQPPRGVLFYGPPGTGKTLVARALASHASRYGGRKVSFYMRKGADVLSKWVGEAERQLRLLFEEAQRNAPAIIFFDEIDGLAPVRSSRQDQIHNSIVSTLLALMDGLDSRGQVVLIGATNRPDSLDGALRRPGRFDRELLFPLPGLQARRSILDIHTRQWRERPGPGLLEELASLCVGYCGADLKAVCAEAALAAVRRRYPQIYASEDKLLVEPATITVERQDFLAAIAAITPASARSAAAHARPLGGAGAAAACLAPVLAGVLGRLQRTFPPAAACLAAGAVREGASSGAGAAAAGGGGGAGGGAAAPSTALILPPGRGGGGGLGPSVGPRAVLAPSAAAAAAAAAAASSGSGLLASLLQRLPACLVTRPRLLVCGPAGCGQAQLAAALLYALEGLPCHAIGLPSLLANPGSRSPEEALVGTFVEARRAAPAVLFLPHLHLWWQTASPALRAVLVMLLRDLPAELPLLLLATAEVPRAALDRELLRSGLFPGGAEDAVELAQPGEGQRREVLRELIMAAAEPVDTEAMAAAAAAAAGGAAGPSGGGGGAGAAAALPKDPSVAATREAEAKAAEELRARRAYEEDQSLLRALRMALRGLTLALLNDRRWRQFAAPPDPQQDPEYWQLVSTPMDLATVLARVDGRQYLTPSAYMADMQLIAQCAKQYYGDGPAAAKHVSRAQSLVDVAEAHLIDRVPLELAKRCEDMVRLRGGPAKPPPGMQLPEELAAAKVKEAAAAAAAAAAVAAAANAAAARGVGSGGPAGARTRGDRHGAGGGGEGGGGMMMLDDPEVLLRRLARQQQKDKLKQQQQQQQQDSAAAGGSGGEAAAAAAAGADGTPAAAEAGAGGVEAMAVDENPEQGLDNGKEAMSPPKKDATPAAAGEAEATDIAAAGAGAAAPAAGDGQAEAGGGAAAAVAPGPSAAFGGVNSSGRTGGRQGMEVDAEAGSGAGPSQPSAAEAGQPSTAGGAAVSTAGAAEAAAAGAAAAGNTNANAGAAPRRALQADPEVVARAEALLERVVAASQGCSLEALELLYTRAAGVVVAAAARTDRGRVLLELEAALEGLLPAAAGGAGAAGGVNARGAHR